MRNINEHPITADEVTRVLETMYQVNPPGTPPHQVLVGGVNDLIRQHILDYLQKPENMAALLEAL